MRAFAIFVDKRELAVRGRLSSTRELAWNSLFQRLSKLHDHDRPGEKSPILLVHDEGEDLTIRKLARRARRYLTAGSAYGTGPIRLSARWLLDDPVSRQSHHSLFIQCADLVAYAATKHLIPGGRRQTRVCVRHQHGANSDQRATRKPTPLPDAWTRRCPRESSYDAIKPPQPLAGGGLAPSRTKARGSATSNIPALLSYTTPQRMSGPFCAIRCGVGHSQPDLDHAGYSTR